MDFLWHNRNGIRSPRGMTVDLALGATQEGEGDVLSPHSVVAPESALGSVPTVALSSAQVRVVVRSGPVSGECSSRHCCSNSNGVR